MPEPAKPNILLVVLDDVGWADLGCYGSEIKTPVMDRLAYDGLRLTNFHVTPLCSPTRAALLTGRNHHRVGMGWLAHHDFGVPGRRGRVSRHAAMLPEVLRASGYATFLVGKWHLALTSETTPAGPFSEWPTGRGFDRFYGFLGGATDQYEPDLVRGTDSVNFPVQSDYHLSADLVTEAQRYVSDHLAFRSADPFFLQLAFSTAHTPHQAPAEYIEEYVEIFEKGWDQTRTDRLNRQKELGLLAADVQLAPRNAGVREWRELSDREQGLAVRLQAAYAGFLAYTDHELGRLVDFLELTGVLDDTIVVLLSDNGASDTGGDLGHVNNLTRNQANFERDVGSIGAVGTRHGPGSYAAGWGMAGNTPFRRYKEYVDAGGVRAPLLIRWPRGLAAKGGELRSQFVHAVDIMPTVLDLVGVPQPAGTFGGVEQLPVDGASARAVLDDQAAPAPRQLQYFEIDGLRALQFENYKVIAEHVHGDDFANDNWRLYDTSVDPSEINDLSGQKPDVVSKMIKLWDEEAEENSVLPLDDRRMEEILSLERPQEVTSTRFVFRPQQTRFSTLATGLGGLERSMRITANFRCPISEGVVMAAGGTSGGWAFYVCDSSAIFEYRRPEARVEVTTTSMLTEASRSLQVDIARDADGAGADVTITVEGVVVGTGRLPVVGQPTSYRGRVEIGRDTPPVIGERYRERGDFAISHESLDHVLIELFDT